jgi:hypothetical protein
LVNSFLYSLYHSSSNFANGTNSNAAELIQYLIHPDSFGPSSNTCQRCQFDVLLFTSVLLIPNLVSVWSSTIDRSIGFVKLGRPVPLSNLSVEEKRGVPSITST